MWQVDKRLEEYSLHHANEARAPDRAGCAAAALKQEHSLCAVSLALSRVC